MSLYERGAALPHSFPSRIFPEQAFAMTVHELRTLYDWGYWANRRLMSVLAELTAEELTQPLGGGHSSIRNTLRALGHAPGNFDMLAYYQREA